VYSPRSPGRYRIRRDIYQNKIFRLNVDRGRVVIVRNGRFAECNEVRRVVENHRQTLRVECVFCVVGVCYLFLIDIIIQSAGGEPFVPKVDNVGSDGRRRLAF